jgi:integrase/recombinase XerD
MTRVRDPLRACLLLKEWPDADQDLWRRALDGDIDGENCASALRWRPKTQLLNRQGYGRWINYLLRSGVDLEKTPAERITPEQIRAYLGELRSQRLAPETICGRISQLHASISVMAPDHDWDWLKRRRNRLKVLVREERRGRQLMMFTGDILGRALKAMKRTEVEGVGQRIRSATTYRNWLMIAMLALVPLRSHNFAGLTLSHHLRHVRDDWFIEIPAGEAKGRREIVMPIPPVLHRHLRYYLEKVRPVLLAGRDVDRLWISQFHTGMIAASVSGAIAAFTEKMLGTAIKAHRFRHIAATTTVVSAPKMVEAARALLTHCNPQTTQDHYILGQSLTVGREHATLIANLRRRTSVMK